ncbi:MAG: hypothetical protein MUO72_11415 [Bacteroidales bacterium]|nr:hypothetical protein [Bacteroidales bacterium]
MKCLSRTEIQEFLDKEIEPSLMAEISDHIEKCENCSMIYQLAVEDKEMIGKLLDSSVDENISIPEFRPPVHGRKRNIFYRAIPVMVAAAFIGFIFLFRIDREPVMERIPEAEMLMYEFLDGKDLNKLWHDKSQIFILQDEKGKVIQSFITY